MGKLGNWMCKHGIHNHTIYKTDRYSTRYTMRYYTKFNHFDIPTYHIKQIEYAECKRCKKKFKRRNDDYQFTFWKEIKEQEVTKVKEIF